MLNWIIGMEHSISCVQYYKLFLITLQLLTETNYLIHTILKVVIFKEITHLFQ